MIFYPNFANIVAIDLSRSVLQNAVKFRNYKIS